jgi:heptosyltransferase-2
VFPNSPRSALEVFFARVPRRVGVTRPWRNFFLTDVIVSRSGELPMRKKSPAEVRRLIGQAPAGKRQIFPQSAHHTLHYLHIVAFLGANPIPVAPRLVVTEQELTDVRHKFCEPDGSRPIVGYNAGAEYGPAKRWPIERFIDAARRIHQKTGCTSWVFGGTMDQLAARQMVGELSKGGVPARSLAGETTLRELCAALRACDLVVTNDTGPMHVAVAVGTPVIVPFGSTSPELTGPAVADLSHHVLLAGNAPCAPCFRRECPIDLRCLRDVTVEHVVSAALQLLGARVRSA